MTLAHPIREKAQETERTLRRAEEKEAVYVVKSQNAQQG